MEPEYFELGLFAVAILGFFFFPAKIAIILFVILLLPILFEALFAGD